MPKYKIFAAIDLGSTQISMKIAQISAAGIDEIDKIKYELSIGKETYKNGKISYETVEKICACFESFLNIMRSYGADDYMCYATTAIREASNSEYIIDQINIRTGIKVNIISNEEERFLHNKALALNNPGFDDMIDKGAIIADIGSGGVQISHYENSRLKFSQAIPLGALRVLEILSSIDKNSVSFKNALENYINTVLEKYKRNFFNNTEYKYFITISGQLNKIKRIINTDGDTITYNELVKAYDILSRFDPESISEDFGISYDEAQLLLPSVIMYKNFIETDKKPKDKIIIASDISMLDGICVEYAEKNKYIHTKHIFTNDIISGAMYCGEKYKTDKNHNDAVISFCESVFNSLAKRFGLSKRDFVSLEVAAIFADTGCYINTNNYSRYSYDIVRANPIIGISQKELEIISYVVLFHAEDIKLDTPEYMRLPKSRRLLISKLTAILAISKALDSSYGGKIKGHKIKAKFKDRELIIRVSASDDIILEKRSFDIAAPFFEEVFGIKPKLTISKC